MTPPRVGFVRKARKEPPFVWNNDSRTARAEWKRFLRDGRKGPQLRPPPTEETRREGASWECARLHKRLMFRRADRRFGCFAKDQLRGLPRANFNTEGAGVYFLWLGPELIYIGKAVQIGSRLWQHHNATPRKPFTHATYLVGPDELIRDFESDLVVRYRPPFNFTNTG